MNKADKERLIKMAQEIAKTMAEKMQAAYVAAITKYAEDYANNDALPDANDFFAWVENYDWS